MEYCLRMIVHGNESESGVPSQRRYHANARALDPNGVTTPLEKYRVGWTLPEKIGERLRLRMIVIAILGAVALSGWSKSFAEDGLSERCIVPESRITAEERAQIESAVDAVLKETPVVPAAKKRRLLIYDVNRNYGGHGSIPYASLAISRLGEKSGAWETVVSHEPSSFSAESLATFDAVFMNNNVGNCFRNPEYRENLRKFVENGGGLMGIHGTTCAFMNWDVGGDDWPEFGRMIGSRNAIHREFDEKAFLRVEDPDSPLTQMFPAEGFWFTDEFFRPSDPYSRERSRILLSIDNEKSNLTREPYGDKQERADGDYAVAWCHNYGKGRVFYCGAGHHPRMFWDETMLKFWLAGTQFVLGDLDAPTAPQPR